MSTSSTATAFDVVVLALGPAANGPKVCGLTLAERGRRVAKKSGARHVVTVDSPEAAHALSTRLTGDVDVVVLRCSDQVVHFPLVDAVRPNGAEAGTRVAIGEDGAYAGALNVPAARTSELARAMAADPQTGDRTLAARWCAEDPTVGSPHAPLARHAAATSDERRGATRMLFQLIHKPQDAALAKIYRAVARPLTRALLPTRLTPNAITLIAAVMSLTGCALVARPSYESAVLGALLQHLANYLDCCDGEVARLRHEGSKRGQWFDTLTDEATTVAYTAAVGYHVYQRYADEWFGPYIGWSIPLAVGGALTTIYVVYWYLIHVSRTGNSQDYPVKKGGLEWLAQVTHRDFICAGVLVLAIADLNEIAYAGLGLGGVVSAAILMREHLQLRRDLASGKVVPRPKTA